ncbi:MAG: IS630 family transposase [Bacteroidetes bacterium]|nr:IS630 family transposase [Bacteroidota bacterium]
MLTLTISQADLQILKYKRFEQDSPILGKRLEVLWLKYLGYSHQEIARVSCVCLNSVSNYLRLYQSDGLAGILHLGYQGPVSELKQYESSIKTDLDQSPVQTIKEAAARIEKISGLKRSPTQIRVFLKQMGFKPYKLGHIPGKADPQEQQAFLDEQLNPLIQKALKGEAHLFFVDAAHFVLGFFLCTIWALCRKFIQSPAGRNRLNVLGALHMGTLELETVCNDSYINAQSVMELIRKIAQKYKDLPIYLVLDNARYQRAKVVQQLAKALHVQLVFLPAYSPNLNLIERLWKLMKKQIIYAKYYENKEQFFQAIQTQIDKINHDEETKDLLKTLLKPNFQSFLNSQILTV